MKLILNRNKENEVQTLGHLKLLEGSKILFECKTLELPYKGNRRNVSCIPEGIYTIVKRYSPKFREHLHILNVPDRSYILIHPGSFYFNIEGCILVGSGYKDINNDGYLDIINSRVTLNKLLELLPNELIIEIYAPEF